MELYFCSPQWDSLLHSDLINISDATKHSNAPWETKLCSVQMVWHRRRYFDWHAPFAMSSFSCGSILQVLVDRLLLTCVENKFQVSEYKVDETEFSRADFATFPVTVNVPVGLKARVVFANGELCYKLYHNYAVVLNYELIAQESDLPLIVYLTWVVGFSYRAIARLVGYPMIKVVYTWVRTSDIQPDGFI